VATTVTMTVGDDSEDVAGRRRDGCVNNEDECGRGVEVVGLRLVLA